MAFKGKPPGSGAGDMSRRTEQLRPAIMLSPREVEQARRMRRARAGSRTAIADRPRLCRSTRSRRRWCRCACRVRKPPRGTLNVTLAAHRVVLAERRGNEPLWQTFDRLIDGATCSSCAARAAGE